MTMVMVNRFTVSATILTTFMYAMMSDVTYTQVPEKTYTPVIEAVKTKVSDIQISETNCLYMTIWGEGRSESDLGKELIATVILNRVDSPKYPNTICGVVKQPWQFSMWNENDPNLLKAKKAFTPNGEYSDAVKDSIRIGMKTLEKNRKERLVPNDVLHYHAHHVNPFWASPKHKIEQVGNHVFYALP